MYQIIIYDYQTMIKLSKSQTSQDASLWETLHTRVFYSTTLVFKDDLPPSLTTPDLA